MGIQYRRFGTKRFVETSVWNYHSTLRNIPEELRKVRVSLRLSDCLPPRVQRSASPHPRPSAITVTTANRPTFCLCRLLPRMMGPGVAWWLRRCATSRTVPRSIPGGVTGFFIDIFPSDRTMALGSTQPLVKMSTRNSPGGKGGRCVRLTTSPTSCAECHEIWEPKPPGTLWATPGLLRDCFTHFTTYDVCNITKLTVVPHR